MGELRNHNPYDLKTKYDSKKKKYEGYLHEEIPSGYLNSEDFINFLNRKKNPNRKG